MSVKSTPDGYHTLTPALTVRGGADAIEFYKRVFGATEVMRMAMPDGKVMHAELQIGDSRVMLSDEFPDWGAIGPQTVGACPSSLMVYVDDVDAVFAAAVAAGAKVERPVQDQFWGDRNGMVIDPFGYRWSLATHIEDVTPEEIERRGQAWMQGTGG